MKRIALIVVVLAVLAFAAAGCGGGKAGSLSGDSIAVVGDKSIPKKDFDNILDQAKKTRKSAFPKPGTTANKALRDQIVSYLVEKAEFEQKADQLGVKVSDKQVEERLAQIKKQYFGNRQGQKAASKDDVEKRYQQQIKQQGLTDDQVHDVVRSQLLREAVYNKVTGGQKVTDKEIKAYYLAHKKTYQQPAQPQSRDVRHILVKSRTLAVQLSAQLKQDPAKFPALAKKYSVDKTSAVNGGTLPGGAFRGRTVTQFDRVAFKLKKNEISEPVQTQYGWHIIQALSGIRPATPAKPTPFSQVKEAVRQQLLQTKRQGIMRTWLQKVQKEYAHKIKYQTGYAPVVTAAATSPTTTG